MNTFFNLITVSKWGRNEETYVKPCQAPISRHIEYISYTEQFQCLLKYQQTICLQVLVSLQSLRLLKIPLNLKISLMLSSVSCFPCKIISNSKLFFLFALDTFELQTRCNSGKSIDCTVWISYLNLRLLKVLVYKKKIYLQWRAPLLSHSCSIRKKPWKLWCLILHVFRNFWSDFIKTFCVPPIILDPTKQIGKLSTYFLDNL